VNYFLAGANTLKKV